MADSVPSEAALFPAESLSGIAEQRFGHVLIHQPWGYRLGAVLAGLLTLMIVAFAYLGTSTRKASVTGLLMPEQGMLRFTSAGGGLLAEVKVTEGQYVEAGQVLFVTSGERFSATGAINRL